MKNATRLLFVLCVWTAGIVAGLGGERQPGAALARIRVAAGAALRADTPVSAPLDGLAVPLDCGLVLEELRDGRSLPVPAQIEPGRAPRLWWVLGEGLPPGEDRVYRILAGTTDETPGVRILRDDAALRVLQGGGEVLAYNHAPVPPPEGANPLYARSAFIHPLWSPAGEVLTQIHPRDHIHHLGLWNPWTKTLFEGREVDFWNLAKGVGTVRFVRFNALVEGPVFGGFRASHDHIDLSAPGGEKAALTEEWSVRVWNVGGREQGFRLWDFTSTFSCASASPLLLEKYRYGGFGFRATAAWDEGDYLTSAGKSRKDGHGTRARWCSIFGPTAAGPAGVLFLSHPQNHGHPEPMRIWSHTPEIFFNFCPIQDADWELVPGREYVLRYRMYVHDGAITPAEAEQLWQDYAHPPRVTVEFVGD